MVSKRILVVDDETYIQEVIQICLESVTSWQVSTANSGQECIAKAQAAQPDAILLDLMMPGMDGMMTFEQLQADPQTQEIPVILLTAKLQPNDHQDYIDSGIKSVLVKPFEPIDLANQIAQILQWQLD